MGGSTSPPRAREHQKLSSQSWAPVRTSFAVLYWPRLTGRIRLVDLDTIGLKGEFVALSLTDTGEGYPARRAVTCLRAILHDEAGRQGHGTWPKPSLRLRPSVGPHISHPGILPSSA